MIEISNELIIIKSVDTLQKRSKIRPAGSSGQSYEVTIPKEVVLREARRVGIGSQEITSKLFALWHYNSFRGLYLELLDSSKQDEGHLHSIQRKAKSDRLPPATSSEVCANPVHTRFFEYPLNALLRCVQSEQRDSGVR